MMIKAKINDNMNGDNCHRNQLIFIPWVRISDNMKGDDYHPKLDNYANENPEL